MKSTIIFHESDSSVDATFKRTLALLFDEGNDSVLVKGLYGKDRRDFNAKAHAQSELVPSEDDGCVRIHRMKVVRPAESGHAALERFARDNARIKTMYQ